MKKNIKAISATSLAAVLASTALVPVASAAEVNEVEKSVQQLVIVQDGKNITIDASVYADYLEEGINLGTISYIISNNGNIYALDVYADFLEEYPTLEETFEALQDKGLSVENLELTEGKVEDGKLVTEDEQSEDRLNETLVYNFAA